MSINNATYALNKLLKFIKKFIRGLLVFCGIAWALFAQASFTTEDESQNICVTPPTTIPLKNFKTVVLDMIKEAGFDPQIAERVIQGESAWDPSRIGDNGQSFGLWQIRLFDSSGKIVHDVAKECALEPICATRYAIELLRTPRSWNHWTIYRNLYRNLK